MPSWTESSGRSSLPSCPLLSAFVLWEGLQLGSRRTTQLAGSEPVLRGPPWAWCGLQGGGGGAGTVAPGRLHQARWVVSGLFLHHAALPRMCWGWPMGFLNCQNRHPGLHRSHQNEHCLLWCCFSRLSPTALLRREGLRRHASHVQETATAHKTKCFTKALLAVTSTAVISLYKQLPGECSAPRTSHIKLWDALQKQCTR